MSEIFVESIVSQKTKRGLVNIVLTPEGGESVSVTLPPQEARKIGVWMIEASTVAIDDEIMAEIGDARGVAAFRELRERRLAAEGDGL